MLLFHSDAGQSHVSAKWSETLSVVPGLGRFDHPLISWLTVKSCVDSAALCASAHPRCCCRRRCYQHPDSRDKTCEAVAGISFPLSARPPQRHLPNLHLSDYLSRTTQSSGVTHVFLCHSSSVIEPLNSGQTKTVRSFSLSCVALSWGLVSVIP